ncbi:CPBP family intramembrane glutamic endopeptidase [Streptomyces sp. DSM 41527]|uniref:CPBP family intramembrane glutamic endopeptidase n=1 Tax=Streptomyces mooreae TaxID=3075523 RepID=A0ABU2T8W3_9ACTN|nr:CPBP family intramembrane glutamic endopeptidase [Streptomyces sp. DSM 41527]MDT0457379.1 CPBP family intramembrane glutamic endopeptidase [Streptomyces sp. DSM 41527]
MPGIAAVVVHRWITNEGFKDAGLRLRLKSAWRYYIAAWLGPPLIVAATLALALATALGLWDPDLSGPGGLPGTKELATVLGLMMVALLLTPLYSGEEFGWTSYLRPRLFGGRTVPSIIATGLIWAVWHFPLEIILMWLYQRSGSVWVASLAHAGNNMVLFLILGETLDGREGLGPVTPMLLTLAPMAAICLWLVSPRRLARERRTAAPLLDQLREAHTSRPWPRNCGRTRGSAMPTPPRWVARRRAMMAPSDDVSPAGRRP